MRFVSDGKLLGVNFKTFADGNRYYIRFEASPRAVALIYAMGEDCHFIEPEKDDTGWCQIECTDQTLTDFRDSVDGISDIVYHLPSFGQLILFSEDQ
jgi:hypothetical protein